jgi:hypothetical protein
MGIFSIIKTIMKIYLRREARKKVGGGEGRRGAALMRM